MREILFRGKRADNGEWVEGYVGAGFTIDENRKVKLREFTAFDCLGCSSLVIVSDETIGQYTGLTDKNGKKIFEGDILKGQYDEDSPEDIAILVVLWDNGWRTQQGDSVPDLLEEFDCQICEVIGNIHDNPELLEGGENNETPH